MWQIDDLRCALAKSPERLTLFLLDGQQRVRTEDVVTPDAAFELSREWRAQCENGWAPESLGVAV